MEMPFSTPSDKESVYDFVIAPQTGSAFTLLKDQYLKVVTPTGCQVADLVCINAHDHREKLSTARSADYADTIYLSEGHILYSNRSRLMLTIIEDTCGRHDLLIPPCSLEMFRIVGSNKDYHPSCQENLAKNLARFAIAEDDIPSAFNIFMNVEVDLFGRLHIKPSLATPRASLVLKAEMDLLIGLTACSHEETNDGACKPIEFQIFK